MPDLVPNQPPLYPRRQHRGGQRAVTAMMCRTDTESFHETVMSAHVSVRKRKRVRSKRNQNDDMRTNDGNTKRKRLPPIKFDVQLAVDKERKREKERENCDEQVRFIPWGGRRLEPFHHHRFRRSGLPVGTVTVALGWAPRQHVRA